MLLIISEMDVEKLKRVAEPVLEQTQKGMEFRRENRDWLLKSSKIALAIRRELRIRKMSQQDLAALMGVSPQYVGRVLKGRENLTLETISGFERALGVEIVPVNAGRISAYQAVPVMVFNISSMPAEPAYDEFIVRRAIRNSVTNQS